MEIRVLSTDARRLAADAVVVTVFQPAERNRRMRPSLRGAAAALDTALGGAVRGLIGAGEIRAAWGEQTLLHSLGRVPAQRVLVMGGGSPRDFTLDRTRIVAADACRALTKIGVRHVGLMLPEPEGAAFNVAQATQAVVEGAVLGTYRFSTYQRPKPGEGRRLDRLSVLGVREQMAALNEAIRRGWIVADAANAARDLVNEPGNTLTPRVLARRAQDMARAAGLQCAVLGTPELRRLGAGGLLGVARGSAEPPRLIVLTYRGRRGGPHLGLVGKGVTFDSGGISIKPAENMEAMKGDMAGAAAVLAAICAIAQLRLPLQVSAVIPATENLPGGTALKPGDILRAMTGTTMEVINTDAEGRLILADALAYARRRGVTHLVDVATLTGACVVALGTINTGAFSNDRAWQDHVVAAGTAAGERIWPMPMDPEYDELIASDVAEIKNTGGRKGGAILGAKFLERFVGETPWVHLDIAGTAAADKEKGYLTKGATGVMVRTFVALAHAMVAKPTTARPATRRRR